MAAMLLLSCCSEDLETPRTRRSHVGKELSDICAVTHRVGRPMSVRELIEATLRGKPPVFTERCNLPGILAAIELYGIPDVHIGLLSLFSSLFAHNSRP